MFLFIVISLIGALQISKILLMIKPSNEMNDYINQLMDTENYLI